MKYFIAIDKDKQIVSLVYAGGEPIISKLNYTNISKKKCVYYSEKEIERIEFPEEVRFEEIDPKKFGGCKLIPKAEEEKEEKIEFYKKLYNTTNTIGYQNDLLNGEKDI